jgi:hypothetical protein
VIQLFSSASATKKGLMVLKESVSLAVALNALRPEDEWKEKCQIKRMSAALRPPKIFPETSLCLIGTRRGLYSKLGVIKSQCTMHSATALH